MEKIGIRLLNPWNESTCGLNCYFHISITNCREHYLRFGSNGRVQVCKSIRPTHLLKAYSLPPAYPDQINFQPPTLPQNWGDKGAEGKQKLVAQITTWITTILIIITLLAILYTIFKKCRYVSSLPRVCFPLYPFSTILQGTTCTDILIEVVNLASAEAI